MKKTILKTLIRDGATALPALAAVLLATFPQSVCAQATPGPAAAKGGASLSSILPPPDAPFDGVIGRTYKDSTPAKIPVITAPAGAPNVLIVLIDDAGFGQWGTFGGQVPTPNLDKLALSGLRYTRFHTTAMDTSCRSSSWPPSAHGRAAIPRSVAASFDRDCMRCRRDCATDHASATRGACRTIPLPGSSTSAPVSA
jgi:hypothetical protein